jgi:hypothetical protein
MVFSSGSPVHSLLEGSMKPGVSGKVTSSRLLALAAVLAMSTSACGDDEEADGEDTTTVGTFSGLFDDIAVGFNYPYDIGLVRNGVTSEGGVTGGDMVVANYGTSELLLARDPGDNPAEQTPEPYYDGAEAGLRGAMGVSVPPDGTVWAAFERGGENDKGGIVALSRAGERVALIDDAVEPGAFANPSGICYGGEIDGRVLFFYVNKADGTLWRISAEGTNAADALLSRVGSGLATGLPGNPGTPPDGVKNKDDLPVDGARGCAALDGYVYVADAQNQRVVRFDGADLGEDIEGVALEDTPAELVTYPTGVTINNEGALIVISFDNAHAFVSLETPRGAFLDNGLYDLNVNSGNYAVQVGDGTIWFTRANNENGALRAITEDSETPPSTAGAFPAQ